MNLFVPIKEYDDYSAEGECHLIHGSRSLVGKAVRPCRLLLWGIAFFFLWVW